MVDVKCLQCGKKVGESSKPTSDTTDKTAKVKDYAVLCNECCSGDRTKFKKEVIDKMN
jgi:hypothetical protein